MSMEITSIRQQLPAMDRQMEEMPNGVQRGQPAGQQPEPPMQPADVSTAVEQIQKIADMFNRELKFQVSDELNRVIVKVIDSSTDKVIREIPSAEIQKLQLQIQEAIGLLFDQSI